ncbi:MAG TPA: MlaD family protein [Steroidobacteraceae bacterium]|nr:MlaD family protein [Steroidobacteraceae bacterium]
MANESDLNDLPRATVERKRAFRISVVWIIPILAAVVAIGIAIQRIRNQGPTIHIVVKRASGIEAGKTFIKYKDVTIGQVTTVELSDDFTKVLVTAQIAKHAEGLMVEDARFWVVEPRVSLSGVSGLSTLLSGQYIGFQAGQSLKKGRVFTTLETAPVITDQPGLRLRLKAKSLGSLGVGAPIYFRSLPVGEVEAYTLAADGKSIEATVFIDAPYDRYVTSGVRFWNASGIEVSAGANGVDIRTESIVSVLVGGIAFDVPEFLPPGELAAANTEFALYPSRALAMTQPDAIERHFVLYFNESLRGLSVGAPVTLFGLTVGRVADVGLSFDPKTDNLRPRVLVTFYPERLMARVSAKDGAPNKGGAEITTESRARLMRHLIEDRGVRAQLQSGSLLTGELYVAFEAVPNAPKVAVDWSRDPLELPVASGGLASIEAKLNSILTKVDNMPLAAIGTNVNNVLATLNLTLKQADALLGRVDSQLLPEGTKTLEALHRAIADADRSLLGKDAPTSQDLHDMMQELTSTARAVRVLVEYLQQHPSTLIRGKKEDKP